MPSCMMPMSLMSLGDRMEHTHRPVAVLAQVAGQHLQPGNKLFLELNELRL